MHLDWRLQGKGKVGVVFVCMGNICRSPSAEGVFRAIAHREGWTRNLLIDSAGTHDYHIGEPPDPRAIASAQRRGYDIKKCRARQFDAKDFARFDWILAMDSNNLHRLMEMRPNEFAGHVGLLLDFAPDLGVREVPDPYYGGPDGFERILDLIEPASEALLARIMAAAPTQPKRA